MQTIGVDGCKAGWVACFRKENFLVFEVFANFKLLIEAFDDDTIIAVDMPIGLPDRIFGSGRPAEIEARKFVGGKRAASVFSMPSRQAIYTFDWVEARKVAQKTSEPPRNFSIQAWNLLPKVRQIDELMRGDFGYKRRVFETHPEIVFRSLSNGALEHYKKTPEGHRFRKALLQNFGLPIPDTLPIIRGAAADDLVDSAAALACAERISKGIAQSFPNPPALDSFNIPIAIWA